jgi:hypothetical protein
VATDSYKIIKTAEFPVSIAPGEEEPPVPAVVGGSKETVARLASDIRHIKPVPPTLETAPQPLPDRVTYWLAWGIPLILMVGGFVWQRQQAYLSQNIGVARRLGARKRAQQGLNTARAQPAETWYTTAGQILITYLSDKLDRPVGGLTQDDLITLLAQNNLGQPLIQRVMACLAESDTGRFAPTTNSTSQAEKLLNEIERLLDDLEKIWQHSDRDKNE